jgi:predicted transposase/invertase (TIGR01784 family)
MTRDPLFYRFFKDLPGCFFQLIGQPASDADRYDFKAIEYKETSVRLDGVFMPRINEVGLAYILEVQYYPSETVYANIMSKIGRFLEHGDPAQDWVAVVIYPNRSMEQKNLKPYECLIESRQLRRIYLDELPPAFPDQFEMGVLELMAAKPEAALEKAKAMVPRIRKSKRAKQFQRTMIEFIETVILYQFPHWSREEIEKMLQVSDVRKTRVFQEAREEGLEEGREEGREKEREAIASELLGVGRPIDEIAKVTGLAVSQVRKLKKRKQPGSRKPKK